MTVEAGAITGELELLTRPASTGDGLEVRIRYAGARDLYTVSGSPVDAGVPDGVDPQASHEQILKHLSTPTATESGNEYPRDLRDFQATQTSPRPASPHP